MNVLQIGDNDLIGNKFNGHDLHLYLNERGHSASHLVMQKESVDPYTSCYGLYKPEESFTKNLFYEPLLVNSDIIHLHLVHNTPFDLNYLRLLSRLKPIVWTVHDPWLLSGHCIHSFGCLRWRDNCGDCPSLQIPFSVDHDATALNVALKRMALDGLPITYVVASGWMDKLLKSSGSFGGKKVCQVPFGINQAIFHPVPKQTVCTELGICIDDIVVMFRSDASPFKGLDLILDALSKLKVKKQVTILAVGQRGLLGRVSNRYSINEFGWIKDDLQLAKLYQASDIFLMPSSQEAFGMMAIEAMSCGTMVLAIPGTSLPDVINAPECGVVAEEALFAVRLQQLLDNTDEISRRGEHSFLFAKQNYAKDVYIDRILSVYVDAVSSHKLDDDASYVLNQLKKYPLNRKNPSIQQDFRIEPSVPSTSIELSPTEIKMINVARRMRMVPGANTVGRCIKRLFR